MVWMIRACYRPSGTPAWWSRSCSNLETDAGPGWVTSPDWASTFTEREEAEAQAVMLIMAEWDNGLGCSVEEVGV